MHFIDCLSSTGGQAVVLANMQRQVASWTSGEAQASCQTAEVSELSSGATCPSVAHKSGGLDSVYGPHSMVAEFPLTPYLSEDNVYNALCDAKDVETAPG